MESDVTSYEPREAALPVLEVGKQPQRRITGLSSKPGASRAASPQGTEVRRRRPRVGSAAEAKRADKPRSIPRADLREARLAASHQLSERLTAIINYLAFFRCSQAKAAFRPMGPDGAKALEKAVAQAALAGAAMNRLRRLLDGTPAETASSIRAEPMYRVRFCNEFARGAVVVKACQRTVVIRSARSRERAVEAAKKRFARLEGIRDWRTHAQTIEVETLQTA
jgi:hypothetical protein